MTDQIFQTQNTALAVTLATCGVPFDKHPQTGRPMPFVNLYDRARLEQLGYRGSGMSIEDAAGDAWRRGKPGTLVYCFLRVDPIEAVLRAWDKHSAAIAKADDSSGGSGSQPVSVMPVDPEAAAAICCQYAKNRKVMAEGWRTAVPWVCYPGAVRSVSEGGKTYRVGSMRLHTLGASAATKEKIGL